MSNPLSAMLPSFEDVRKLLQFWFDQQDKYFYFETTSVQSGTLKMDKPDITPMESVLINREKFNRPISRKRVVTHYRIEESIVAKITDVLSFPPSLFLKDVTVNLVEITLSHSKLPKHTSLATWNQETYGLVMPRIHYYERISPQDPRKFMEENPRWIPQSEED